MSTFNSIYDAVDFAVRSYGLPVGGPPIATAARVLVDVDGNVVNVADLVSASSPLTATSISFNTKRQSETLDLTPAATIAALTVVFPSNATSRIGQELRITSSHIVTALTVTATTQTVLGTALTALAVDTPVIFKKIKASVWVRII